MEIILTKDCAGHSKGDTIDTEDRHALIIISLGMAVPKEREKIEKLETKVPEKIETNTAPRTRKPRTK